MDYTQCQLTVGTLVFIFMLCTALIILLLYCLKKEILTVLYIRYFDDVNGKYYLAKPVALATFATYDFFGDMLFLSYTHVWGSYPVVLLSIIILKEILKAGGLVSTLFHPQFQSPGWFQL